MLLLRNCTSVVAQEEQKGLEFVNNVLKLKQQKVLGSIVLLRNRQVNHPPLQVTLKFSHEQLSSHWLSSKGNTEIKVKIDHSGEA